MELRFNLTKGTIKNVNKKKYNVSRVTQVNNIQKVHQEKDNTSSKIHVPRMYSPGLNTGEKS